MYIRNNGLKQRFSLWSKRRKHCQAAKLDLLSSFSPMTIYPNVQACPFFPICKPINPVSSSIFL